jgi:outer membrane protein assembly factor BamB
LFVINDNERDSYLLALDKYTGEELWRVERDEKSNWSTPYLWQHEGGQELVTLGSGQVRSYDLDGELLWTLSGMSSITIATPYTYQDRLIISSGYVLDGQRPIYAIRHGGRGDLSVPEGETTNDWVVWSHPTAAPYNPTTLIYQGFLYVLYDRGLLACYRAEDGSLVYDRQRLPGRGAFTASPWGARGRVFCLNEDGETVVVPVGESFSVEAVNRLRDDDMTLATPALAGSRLLIRTLSRLYCIAPDAARQRVEPRE